MKGVAKEHIVKAVTNGFDRNKHYILAAFESYDDYLDVLNKHPHLKQLRTAKWDAEVDGPSAADFTVSHKQRKKDAKAAFAAAMESESDSDDEGLLAQWMTSKAQKTVATAKAGGASAPRTSDAGASSSRKAPSNTYAKGNGGKLSEYGVRHLGDGSRGDDINTAILVPTGATIPAAFKPRMSPQLFVNALFSNLSSGTPAEKVAEDITSCHLGSDLGKVPLSEYVASLADKSPAGDVRDRVLFVSALLASTANPTCPPTGVAPSSSSSSSARPPFSAADTGELRAGILGAGVLGGFGRDGSGQQTSTARNQAMMQAQMRFIGKAASADPQFKSYLQATSERERLVYKQVHGKAISVEDLTADIPDAPERLGGLLGVPSAASIGGDGGRALLWKDLTLRAIYAHGLSGKVLIDNSTGTREVVKVVGVVSGWFKPDPSSEDDCKDVMFGLKLGTEAAVDKGLATEPQSLITVLGNETKFNAKRFTNMPRVPDATDTAAMARRFEVFFDFEVSGGPEFEKERQYFSRPGDGSEFSPFKYKCLEYVDWAM